MLSHAVLRLLDSFFRRPVLCLLPFVLFAVLGGASVATVDAEYHAGGVLLVEDRTLLSSLTEVRGTDTGWQTPAAYTSRQLNAMLQTDSFMRAVAEGAGIGNAEAMSRSQLGELRSLVGSREAGEDLVHVWSTHEDPRLAHQLADATIESLIQWQIEAEVSQSTAAESFLTPLTEQYREDLGAARDALQDYLQANPAPEDGARPATQQTSIDALSADVEEANTRYTDAVAKEESARLATAQAESDVRNRLQLVDAPEVPDEPAGRLRTAVVTLAAFLATGGLLSVAVVVAGAVVDQSLRFPADVTRRLGVEVLAVLPDAPAALGPPLPHGSRP